MKFFYFTTIFFIFSNWSIPPLYRVFVSKLIFENMYFLYMFFFLFLI